MKKTAPGESLRPRPGRVYPGSAGENRRPRHRHTKATIVYLQGASSGSSAPRPAAPPAFAGEDCLVYPGGPIGCSPRGGWSDGDGGVSVPSCRTKMSAQRQAASAMRFISFTVRFP